MSRLVELAPHQFAERLRAEGARRAYLVYDPGMRGYHASHPVLRDLAQHLALTEPSAREHEAVFFGVGPTTGALFAVFLHQTTRGQGLGGVRHASYETLDALLRDGLRLSVAMTRRNGLAGLWWGGAAGLVARAEGDAYRDTEHRHRLFGEFGDFVSSLRGCYVASGGAGTTPSDMGAIFGRTRFVTCVPPEHGGSGSPADVTAAGVVCAMEAALEFVGRGGLAGKTVAMQGTGNVGAAMIPRLLARGVARIVASEIAPEQRAALLDTFEGKPVEIRSDSAQDHGIVAEECDVLAPNALGGLLDSKTIPRIRASVVCGAADDPLLEPEWDARTLSDRGITYVPDFVSNRMGSVQCSNEQYGTVNGDVTVRRHLRRDWHGGIYRTTRKLLELASESGSTPLDIACRVADALARHPHPIWGARTRHVVESLVADRWERG